MFDIIIYISFIPPISKFSAEWWVKTFYINWINIHPEIIHWYHDRPSIRWILISFNNIISFSCSWTRSHWEKSPPAGVRRSWSHLSKVPLSALVSKKTCLFYQIFTLQTNSISCPLSNVWRAGPFQEGWVTYFLNHLYSVLWGDMVRYVLFDILVKTKLKLKCESSFRFFIHFSLLVNIIYIWNRTRITFSSLHFTY